MVLELEAQADKVFANADQLKQVFLNLTVNAADAMEATSERPQGGQLRVRTRSFAGESLVKERTLVASLYDEAQIRFSSRL